MKLCVHDADEVAAIPEIEIDRFPFVIGRQNDCDCCVPLAFISRRHCLFTLEGSQIQVQDLGSHNGTFVNGRKATSPVPVHHGHELTLGTVALRVVMPAHMLETADEIEIKTKEEAALPKDAES
jgi:pSer/pThr/pTyr-binding forkhead associated (FHA) protein